MPLFHPDTTQILEKIGESDLVQLVYISSLTIKGRLNSSVFDDIEKHARQYNKQYNITGTLCYGNGQFLQCIEGAKADVMLLKQSIFADERHRNIRIIKVEAIHQRSFVDWNMRLLFLERWLWSPDTKQQAAQLSPFLPFVPFDWTVARTEQFLQTIRDFQTTPHTQAAGITYNALGNMVQHIAAPHQAFLLIQGVLSMLIVIALSFFVWA